MTGVDDDARAGAGRKCRLADTGIEALSFRCTANERRAEKQTNESTSHNLHLGRGVERWRRFILSLSRIHGRWQGGSGHSIPVRMRARKPSRKYAMIVVMSIGPSVGTI